MAFERLKKVFGRKEELPAAQELPKTELPKPITAETTTTENVKAKMDLLLTQLESLNVRYETLNQRLANLEKMVQEIYAVAKRS